MSAVYYIYKFTSPSNKSYIGFTENIDRRWNDHMKRAARKINCKLYDAINKYGWDNFGKDIIYCSKDQIHTLKEMEPYFINLYDCVNNGYNMTCGGDGIPGYTHSDKTKKKMSEAKLGENNNFFGKTHDEETRKIMSEKAKLRPTRLGENAPNYGKTHTDEWKKTMAEKNATSSWIIIFPDGHNETIKNLKNFCRENGLTFSNMLAVAGGRQKQHKGYKCFKTEN